MNENAIGFLMILMPLAAFLYASAAGIAGAYLAANRFNVPVLKHLLATVLLIAASKFLIL